VYLLAPPEKITGDAAVNLGILRRLTGAVQYVGDNVHEAAEEWYGSDILVDALFGTGLQREVKAPYYDAIFEMNECVNGLRVAVDIPSGLDADTGRVLGCAFQAHVTATYGFRKLGMTVFPGIEYCGEVEVVDICIPSAALAGNPPTAQLYTAPDPTGYLLKRLRWDAHKGDFGHTLIVGGSTGKTGAPAMAAKAASRIGSGLVTVAVPASLNPILEAKLNEEMTYPLAESTPGHFGKGALPELNALTQGKSCVVFGPGISTAPDVLELVSSLLETYEGPLLIDADGLNVLAGNLDRLKNAKGMVTLTPHPGEMSRLTGLPTAEIQKDRCGVVRRFAEEYGVWVTLKGAGTITAGPDGGVTINHTGNPWMASGGQGDVLSGVMGGLLAQGVEVEDAAPLGVYLHGLAADQLLETRGPCPISATDVIERLSLVVAGLTAKEDEG
jgi:NAD(P)H-hydrate epimerase